MKATLELPFSDPINIRASSLNTTDLLKKVFPGGIDRYGKYDSGYEIGGEVERLAGLSKPSDDKKFVASVWTPGFYVTPYDSLNIFQDALVEHKNKCYELRTPTLHEYLSFQDSLFTSDLIGATEISHEEDFDETLYDDSVEYLEPFNVKCHTYTCTFPPRLYAHKETGRRFDEYGRWLFVLREKKSL